MERENSDVTRRVALVPHQTPKSRFREIKITGSVNFPDHGLLSLKNMLFIIYTKFAK